jgi:AbrB family looped-hinge helix DNA binding protein
MSRLVKVGKNGRVTIPKAIRTQCGIKEGNLLIAEKTGNGVLFKPAPKISGVVGIDAGYATVDGVNKMIDKLREEY